MERPGNLTRFLSLLCGCGPNALFWRDGGGRIMVEAGPLLCDDVRTHGWTERKGRTRPVLRYEVPVVSKGSPQRF